KARRTRRPPPTSRLRPTRRGWNAGRRTRPHRPLGHRGTTRVRTGARWPSGHASDPRTAAVDTRFADTPTIPAGRRRDPWAKVDAAPPSRETGSVKHADVAQLVEHHLAKVRVAGSSPVIRSKSAAQAGQPGGLAERRGSGLQSRIHGFESRTHLARAIGAAVARFPDTEEVTGSIPVSPTAGPAVRAGPGGRRGARQQHSDACPRRAHLSVEP